MLFNSFEFLIFFIVVFSLYLFSSHRLQNIILLIASYFFYGWWDWRFLSLVFLSTLIDYYVALKIDGAPTPSKKKKYLLISVFVNLGILGFFKYFNFFAGSLNGLVNYFGFKLNPFVLQIILPVGISFY